MFPWQVSRGAEIQLLVRVEGKGSDIGCGYGKLGLRTQVTVCDSERGHRLGGKVYSGNFALQERTAGWVIAGLQ